MSLRIGRRPLALAAMVLALGALALTGCSKKLTTVDSGYTTPEGTPTANARLVVYPDKTNERSYYLDLPPPGPDPNDPLDRVQVYRYGTDQTAHGVILDGTAANGYQVLRVENGGGLRVLKDFTSGCCSAGSTRAGSSTPSTTTTSSAQRAASVQRGVVSGVISGSSPITGISTITDTSVADIHVSIVYGNRGLIPPEPYIDSLFTLQWAPVPGAASYILDVYQLRGDLRSEDERALSGVAAPLYFGKTNDIYIVLLPPTVTRYKLGDTVGTTQTRTQTFYGRVYAARVTALDARGKMIGFSHGDQRLGPGGDGEYSLYSLGAIEVSPSVVPPFAAFSAAGAASKAPVMFDAHGRPGRLITVGTGPEAFQVIRFE